VGNYKGEMVRQYGGAFWRMVITEIDSDREVLVGPPRKHRDAARDAAKAALLDMLLAAVQAE